MKNEESDVNMPAFTLAAVATPVVLFGASFGVFNSFYEHSGSVYREIAGFVMAGVVFGLPFYAALGLPLAWFVLRDRSSRRIPRLLLNAVAAALVGWALSLFLIATSCGLLTGDFLCGPLPIYLVFGLPGALTFALVFALLFIGLRAFQQAP